MRKLNIKLAAALAVALVGIGGIVHAVHGVQVKRSERMLLSLADRAEQAGDVADAVRRLERYLAYAPGDAKALARLGLLLDGRARSTKQRQRVLATFEQVLRLDPSRGDIRRRFVRIAMDDPALDRLSDARDHLTILLEASPKDGDLEGQLGRCEEQRGKYDQATSWYEKSIEHAPKRVDSYVRLAALLREHRDSPDRADSLMDRLVERDGDDPRAHLARAEYRLKTGRRAEAEEDLARARELAPEDADVILVSALAAAGDPAQAARDRARALLARGIELHPKDARIYQALASLEARAGRIGPAIESLQKGADAQHVGEGADVDAKEAAARIRWSLAMLLVDAPPPAGEIDERLARVGEVREQLKAIGTSPERLSFLDARVLMLRDDWRGAAEILDRLDKGDARDARSAGDLPLQISFARGRCYERLGDLERRHAAFRRAADLAPQDPAARLGLAGALEALGRTDQAIAEYVLVARDAPEAWLPALRLMLERNEGLPREQRRWEDVDSALDKAERSLKPSDELTLRRVSALAGRGDVDGAIGRLRGLLKADPERVVLWIALADLAGRRGKPEQQLAILDEAREHLGDRVELRLARAAYWSRQGGQAAPRALADLARDDERLSEEDRRRLRYGLARTYEQSGRHDEASRLWSELARRPDDLPSRIALFDAAMRAGDEASMVRIAKEIRGIEDALDLPEARKGILWRFAEARIAIWRATKRGDRSGLAGARGRLQEVFARNPYWSRAVLAMAQIEELEGRDSKAVERYRRAIDLGERGPSVARLIPLLHKLGRYNEVGETFRKLQAQGVAMGAMKLDGLVIDASLRSGEYDRALELTEQVAPDGEAKDYRDHVRHGLIRLLAASQAEERGRIEEARSQRAGAERDFRRATELAGDRPEGWVALIRFLASDGQEAAARAAAQAARTKLRGEPLGLAECLAAVDDQEGAEQQYQLALKANPKNVPTLRSAAEFYIVSHRAAKAEPLLRQIVASKDAASSDAEWAEKQALPLMLIQTDQGGRREAMDRLGLQDPSKDVGKPGETDVERRVKAQVLAAQAARAERRRAIPILESLAKPSPQDQFLLAQLYDGDGDWRKANERFLGLMTSGEKAADYPTYVAAYITRLLRHGDAPGASLWLDKLTSSDPEGLRTLILRARVLGARGRREEAAALLTGSKHAGGGEDVIGTLAKVLDEDLDRPVEAEAMYRKLAARAKRPEAAFALAGFLARRGRLREALDVCEATAKSCPAAAVIDAAVAVLYSTDFDEAQGRRVDRWIEAATAASPPSAAILFQQANLRTLQGRYEEADDLFRRCSEIAPKSPGPLNNRALLLALGEGKVREALALLDKAEAMLGPTPDILDSRAVVHIKAGDAKAAIRELEDVVTLAPTAASYFHLAQAQKMAGNAAGFKDALAKAGDAKLKKSDLHPLEREAYRRMLAQTALR